MQLGYNDYTNFNRIQMKKHKISFIGPIAPPSVGGPAVRNRIMLDTLGQWNIHAVELNTLLWMKKPFKFILYFITQVWKTKLVIISVSRNGRMLLLPLLAFLRVLRQIHIVFIPAGNTFALELKSLPRVLRMLYIAMLNSFDLVCVQRNELAEQLRMLDYTNALVMPNFKVRPLILSKKKKSNCAQLLFLSRIEPGKGVCLLMSALDILDQKGIQFTIDFYGIIQKDFHSDFAAMLKSRSYARYCGVLHYTDVICKISSYDLMVFPTLYVEGFPGVLADAAMAGLPVVASDVSSNTEIIEDGYNGLLASAKDYTDIAEKIEILIQNEDLRIKMGENNRMQANAYDVEVVLKKFVDKLDELEWWR
jgi:glycosyltransferase involved in cell wall biosynthesis